MNVQTIFTLVSGLMAVAAAIGSIGLLRYLDRLTSDSPTSTEPDVNPYQPSMATEPLTESSVMVASNGAGFVVLVPIMTVVVGTALGVASRWLRPYANIDGVHYEALASLIILVAGCFVLIALNRRGQGSLGHLLYQLENFAMWSGFICGWSLMHGAFWEDLIAVSMAWWLGCALFGAASLALIYYRRHRAH